MTSADVGISPNLRQSYAACRALHREYGRTYFLATLLLPAHKRPSVHALYAFARYADEIVDDLHSPLSTDAKADALARWGERFLADLARGSSDHPICRAVVDTAVRWSIPHEHFAAFLRSMAMDLTVTGYPTYADLLTYVDGSAAVIGLQMLPILEPLDPAAAGHAATLGIAFQLTNFIRDVGEDLRRGRLYLPEEDLEMHGVTRADLRGRETTPAVRDLLAFQVARARALYREAEPGIDLLHPTSRDCVRTAFRLYGGILTSVERARYRVLDRRVAVSLPARARVAAPALVRACLTRGRNAVR